MLKNKALHAQSLLKAVQTDAFVFLNRRNIRYLCGFTGTDGALVVTSGAAVFLTDSRYTLQAREQVAPVEVRQYDRKLESVVQALESMKVRKVGFEAETTSYAVVESLRKASATLEWVPVSEAVTVLRAEKDDGEVELMQTAARIGAEAFEEILPLIRPGAVERDIALALEFAIKKRGAEEKAFDYIVASGHRGALPHGVASDKVIQAGELVTIDFGARYQGYHSDETVTLAVGEVSKELRRIYDVVLEAHDLALAAVRPGASLRDLDAVAREHIAAAGYGEYFGHGLGHGVGLEIHEFPSLSPRAEASAHEGMVVTIEPGIYVPEVGGVRIEDMVLVTAEGARTLTVLPKALRTIAV